MTSISNLNGSFKVNARVFYGTNTTSEEATIIIPNCASGTYKMFICNNVYDITFRNGSAITTALDSIALSSGSTIRWSDGVLVYFFFCTELRANVASVSSPSFVAGRLEHPIVYNIGKRMSANHIMLLNKEGTAGFFCGDYNAITLQNCRVPGSTYEDREFAERIRQIMWRSYISLMVGDDGAMWLLCDIYSSDRTYFDIATVESIRARRNLPLRKFAVYSIPTSRIIVDGAINLEALRLLCTSENRSNMI